MSLPWATAEKAQLRDKQLQWAQQHHSWLVRMPELVHEHLPHANRLPTAPATSQRPIAARRSDCIQAALPTTALPHPVRLPAAAAAALPSKLTHRVHPPAVGAAGNYGGRSGRKGATACGRATCMTGWPPPPPTCGACMQTGRMLCTGCVVFALCIMEHHPDASISKIMGHQKFHFCLNIVDHGTSNVPLSLEHCRSWNIKCSICCLSIVNIKTPVVLLLLEHDKSWETSRFIVT